MSKKINVDLKVIGVVHSPYKNTSDTPFQNGKHISIVEIFDEYVDGLKDIEDFSHIILLYWLHKSKGYNMVVVTPWESKPHGLFTTRSPHRPNPIGIQTVELIKAEGNKLHVRGLDAIEDTPLVDIKPYIKKADMKQGSFDGWTESTELKNK